ncbi:hypothetical protein OBBRIDRAFT_602522 [Obba rivulosa]|uniref:Uncharacterized protein n=1 Tax=Obba rivulosa TaxID=1052685 RepID=A0A8E2DLZ7_9APHY|nr:hypothetical protein OBBRIDRAFT_602522 [Obba rivulosa]
MQERQKTKRYRPRLPSGLVEGTRSQSGCQVHTLAREDQLALGRAVAPPDIFVKGDWAKACLAKALHVEPSVPVTLPFRAALMPREGEVTG